ncbi:MAG: LytTR family DNA-binding domain-containing protein [Bacteroidota bacterium]
MSEQLSAIIVDDERLGRENLAFLLSSYCPSIRVVGIADSAQSARELVRQHQPEVVFLDINMPQEDGFQFLESIPEKQFSVVFVTAHDSYGVQAVKASAVDYILKPIHTEELKTAVNKLHRIHQIKLENLESQANYQQSLDELLQNLLSNQRPKKLTLPHSQGFTLVDMEEIIRLEADDNYTRIFIQNKPFLHMPKTLKYVEGILDEEVFFRTHRSHIINLGFLQSFSKIDGGYAIMSDKTRIPISRRRLSDFLSKVGPSMDI